ncbi:MAG: selenium cofactor biosynthesis protein YqeC [Deltaproteobacteria bacterium]|nr:selenium cofactor biosynthesis protein YqeC [Deltaproteobacteria bacterium]
MSKTTHFLTAALKLGEREHIATVGSGGKTTFGFRLAEEMAGGGKRVVSTTTTKVRYEEGLRYPHLIQSPPGTDLIKATERALETSLSVFVARGRLDSGKLFGVSPGEADRLFTDIGTDHVIVEADGAAGLPLKAPAPQEPVIPSTATMVIALIGLEALGQPLERQWVFRISTFERITGLRLGERITPAALMSVFQDPEGLYKGTPDTSKRVAFMNKCDRCKDLGEAQRLGAMLVDHSSTGVGRVIIGSLNKKTYEIIE